MFDKIGRAARDPVKAGRYLSRGISHQLAVLPYLFTGQCVIELSGKQVVFSTHDWYSKTWFFPRLDGNRLHEPPVSELVALLAGEAGSFLDIGAHLGYFTCLAAALMEGKPVRAFEMDDRAFKRVAENVRINGFENAELFHEAIAEHSGTARYGRPTFIDSGESLTGSGGTEVRARTLDEATRGLPPGLIKIDVEGAELGVLQSGAETLSQGFVLFLEIHGQKLGKFGARSSQVLGLLAAHGYETYEIIGHRGKGASGLARLNISTELTKNVMTLCAPSAWIAAYRERLAFV